MYQKPAWKITMSMLVCLGLALVVLTAAAASSSYLEGEVDLTIDLNAPQHAKADTTFVINIAYGNMGTQASPEDTWVKLTLPAGVSFVSAVDNNDFAMSPIIVDGSTYTWAVGAIPAGICCRHIYATVLVAADVAKGTPLLSQGEIGSTAVELIDDNNTSQVTSIVCDMWGSPQHGSSSPMPPRGGR